MTAISHPYPEWMSGAQGSVHQVSFFSLHHKEQNMRKTYGRIEGPEQDINPTGRPTECQLIWTPGSPQSLAPNQEHTQAEQGPQQICSRELPCPALVGKMRLILQRLDLPGLGDYPMGVHPLRGEQKEWRERFCDGTGGGSV